MLKRRTIILGTAVLAVLLAASLWRRGFGALERPSARSRSASENRALALAWGGFATTSFDSSALNRDHALSLRFLTAYDASYRGVLVADESGSYHLGMAPYSSLGRPALELTVGGATFTYPLPHPVVTDNDFRAGPPRQGGRHWRHLAVSRRGTTIAVALDGSVVGRFEAGALQATGALRLGRLAQPLATQDQFYGFIDDLGVWQAGVAEAELARLTAASGAAPASARLLAKLDFDAPRASGSSLLLNGGARLEVVSANHDGVLDELRLPSPRHRTRLQLPFLADQVWMPIQGINSELTHNDVACFALDFLRIDPNLVADNPRGLPGASHRASEGQPILAPASGQVIALVDSRANDQRSAAGQPLSNFVCLQHEAQEVSCLLHLQADAETHDAAEVEAGQALARVGHSGVPTVHLHFALSDRPESKSADVDPQLVTIPAAFSDYFASRDFGRSWQHVERGTPGPGEWVVRRSH